MEEVIKTILKQEVNEKAKLILIFLSLNGDFSKLTLSDLIEGVLLPKNEIKKTLKNECFDFCREWCNKVSKQKASDSVLYSQDCLRILLYLNTKAKTHYRNTDANLKFIKARLGSGATPEEMMKVIDVKCDEWLGTSMETYLRPETLFNATKFETYYNLACKRDLSVKREQDMNISLSDDEMSIYCS